ncbi:MAG: hypothetical protein ACR2MW_12080 [Chthoniobacterales bacterium]
MDEQIQEDWLDARLRDEATYIDDTGFTALVVRQLPAQRAARNSFRGVLMLAITVLACVVTYFVSDGGRFITSAIEALAAMPLWMVATIALFCGMFGTATAAYVAYVRGREEISG